MKTTTNDRRTRTPRPYNRAEQRRDWRTQISEERDS